MQKLLPILFAFLFLTSISAQDLPKQMTEEEKIIWQTYSPTFNPELSIPPPAPVRTMAEWEELQGIMITWTSTTSHQPILRDIVRYAQPECKVYIVCSDSNSVRTYLSSGGVPITNIKFLLFPFNSIWIRDYGPWTVYFENTDSMAIVDWVYNRPRPSDDNIPVLFAGNIGVPIYQTTVEPNRLVHTGGNFMVDGLGTGFSSKLILNDNSGKTEAQIDAIMNAFMGINRYVKMENLPYDQIHHIDMHMKLLDEETLLVGQYPPGVADGPQIEANLQYVLNNFLTPYGKPYRVIRVPMPPQNGLYPPNANYRTYTNSVIVNKTVIVPTYELQYDTTALRIYQEAMPGYNIVGINCNAIIPSLGAIHCIVKEVGAFNPLFISHSSIRDTLYTYSPIEIKALIKSQAGVSQANIFWTTDTTLGYSSSSMNYLSGDTLVGYIPAQTNATDIYYYISATSNQGKTLTRPMTAPAGFYKFYVDDVVPVELISFYTNPDGNNITLNWVTASEINNHGFEVLRSVKTDNWETIGFVDGYGTSSESRFYTFTDINLSSGVYKYRLKQIDFDGSFNYSGVIDTEILPMGFVVQQNYPNPFNASTVIEFSLPENSSVNLKIFNTLGETIREADYGFMQPGNHKLNLNFVDLPSGTYFYQITASDLKQSYSTVRKMLLLK
jgi:agmatine deiminase